MRNAVAAVQKRSGKVQETLGRPWLPGSKRLFAPSPNHFWKFPNFDPLSQAAWFANFGANVGLGKGIFVITKFHSTIQPPQICKYVFSEGFLLNFGADFPNSQQFSPFPGVGPGKGIFVILPPPLSSGIPPRRLALQHQNDVFSELLRQIH